MPLFTHDRIKTTTGVLDPAHKALYGGNALQSITVGRHTPRNPIQAVGFLGIVDYVSGQITSDVQLDCVIVEGCAKVDDTTAKTTSVYRYAAVPIVAGTEQYVLTSAAIAFPAGSPATFNLGYMSPTIASYLDLQAQPNPSTGEESDFCVIMGDDGSGIELVPTWWDTTTANVPTAGTIPIINAAGAQSTTTDRGIPAGITSFNMSSTINHDNVLDVRTSQPIQFVTTYPVDISADLEVYKLPVSAGNVTANNYPGGSAYNPATFQHALKNLKSLSVQALALAKHITGGATAATAGDVYAKVIGLRQVDESEAVSVGRYLAYTVRFTAADLLLPLVAPA